LTDRAHDVTDEPIRTAERRVHPRTNTDQPAGHGIFELVLLGHERDDPGMDRTPPRATLLVFRYETRTQFDVLSQAQDTAQDGTTSDTAM